MDGRSSNLRRWSHLFSWHPGEDLKLTNIIKFGGIDSWDESIFEFADGTVTLKSHDGHLSLERAIFLLKLAQLELDETIKSQE